MIYKASNASITRTAQVNFSKLRFTGNKLKRTSRLSCGANGTYTGVDSCYGYSLHRTYHDGICGTYTTLHETNSATCGYVAPPFFPFFPPFFPFFPSFAPVCGGCAPGLYGYYGATYPSCDSPVGSGWGYSCVGYPGPLTGESYMYWQSACCPDVAICGAYRSGVCGYP